jgi:hypothetical protein
MQLACAPGHSRFTASQTDCTSRGDYARRPGNLHRWKPWGGRLDIRLVLPNVGLVSASGVIGRTVDSSYFVLTTGTTMPYPSHDIPN